MFDTAPVTKLKQGDERTASFIKLLAVWFQFVGGESLSDMDRPQMDPLRLAARRAAAFYQVGDYASANRAFLTLSNLVARHPRATPLIAKWKEIWQISKDSDAADAAVGRLQEATAADARRFGRGE